MIPKMNGWNILDFELAYDGLVRMEHAAMSVLGQPRSGAESGQLPRGADYLQDLVYDGIHVALECIVEHLKATRYDDPVDERRRVWLIIKNDAEFPDPDRSVSEVLQELSGGVGMTDRHAYRTPPDQDHEGALISAVRLDRRLTGIY